MKKGLRNIVGFLLLIGFFTLLSFAKDEQDKRLVKKVNVSINATEGDAFMDKDDIINLVYSRQDTLVGKTIGSLHLSEIENLLSHETSVKNAEAYVESNGNVNLNIELKKVIARIKPDSTVGFYVDENGGKMEWIAKYSPRVLTITGNLKNYNRYLKDTLVETDLLTHSKLVNDVYEFAKYVNKDIFWRYQIAQVYINQKGDAILIPLIGNEEFVFGELINFKKKFKKIKRYYEEIAPKLGWNKYREVNVKFEKQIVCK